MVAIEIRKVIEQDIKKLQKISIETFSQTFSASNTEEDMVKYLDNEFSLSKLTDELKNKNAHFYFAMYEGNVIGYLKLNSGPAQTELKDNNALEIERIYVLSEYHGKHVGQLLYDKAIEVARHMNAEYIWLGVWEENSRAINFYHKNGFVAFDKHIFKLGDDEQTDIMMKLNLNTN